MKQRPTMRFGARELSGTAVSALLMALALALLPACLEEGGPEPNGFVPCVNDTDCPPGQSCVGGTCELGSAGDAAVPVARPQARLLTESLRYVDVGRGRVETRQLRIANLGDANLEIERVEVVGTSGRVTVTPDPGAFLLVVPPNGEFPLEARFVGSDGVALSGSVVLHTNDPALPRASVPVVIEYTGRPQLLLTQMPDGQHAENLDGSELELGPIPAGIGRSRHLYLKNLGVGGMYAVFEPPQVVGSAAFELTLEPEPDTDGRYRLGRFAGFCTTGADCTGGTICLGRVCEAAGVPEDGLRLTINVDLADGELATAEVLLPYGNPSGGVGDVLRLGLAAVGVAPGLHVDPGDVAFGDISIGFPVSRVVRLTNATDAGLQLTRVELSGTGALPPGAPIRAAFLGGALPMQLVAGAETLVRVDFIAGADRLGAATAELEVETAERPGDPYRVPVSGRARVGPLLATVPLAEVDGGAVHVGQAAHATVAVRNVAGASADGLNMLLATVQREVGLGEFSVSPSASPTPVAPGAELLLDVTCTPDAVGTVRGTLTLLTDAPDNPDRNLTVRCDGTNPDLGVRYESNDSGIAVTLDLADPHACRNDPTTYPPPCMDLGDLYLGGSAAGRVWLRNDGDGPLEVSELSLMPDDVGFALDTSAPLSIAAGGERLIEVSYVGEATPTLAQSTLRVAHDDADSPSVELRLVGSTRPCDAGLNDCGGTPVCDAALTVDACCRQVDDPRACGPSCAPCATFSHTLRTCAGSACTYSCAAGWYDLNGASGDGGDATPGDGCEYGCTLAAVPTEVCNGADDDCNGSADDGLSLSDAGGSEAPEICAPGIAPALVGWLDESDLPTVIVGSGEAGAEVAGFDGRVYASGSDPRGDVDWLRLVFSEVNACSAIGMRFDVGLDAPVGSHLELCGHLRDPAGTPPLALDCDEVAGVPVLDACTEVLGGASGTLRFEWSEVCGQADDRVLDLRVRAAQLSLPEEAYACEAYRVRVVGAQLE